MQIWMTTLVPALQLVAALAMTTKQKREISFREKIVKLFLTKNKQILMSALIVKLSIYFVVVVVNVHFVYF